MSSIDHFIVNFEVEQTDPASTLTALMGSIFDSFKTMASLRYRDAVEKFVMKNQRQATGPEALDLAQRSFAHVLECLSDGNPIKRELIRYSADYLPVLFAASLPSPPPHLN